jgi:uncharacterized membrane protein YjjP (DUF1212 family)
MSAARVILVALIVASPLILLWDGLIAQAAITASVSLALLIIAVNLSASEVKFLSFFIKPVAMGAGVLALWILFQIIPIRGLAHPIWMSAASALAQPLTGSISIDPGASVIALLQYAALCAVAFLAAAVAIDRERAKSLLFVLAGSGALISLLMIFRDLLFPGYEVSVFQHAQEVDYIGMGVIFAAAAGLQTLERYETPRSHTQGSSLVTRWTLIACAAVSAVCLIALFLDQARDVIVAAVCGLAVLLSIVIIRRVGLTMWLAAAMSAPIICIAVLIIASRPTEPGMSRLLAFSDSPIGQSERILDDAPLTGTGAGTYAAIAPIYRVKDNPEESSVAPTFAASLAIELGRPMLALIATLLGISVVIFLRASFVRRRDSIYPAAGASCLTVLSFISFINNGLAGHAAGLMIAVAFGLALGQTKSRTRASE